MSADNCPLASAPHVHIGDTLLYFPTTGELKAITSVKPLTASLVASNVTTQEGLQTLLWSINRGLIFLS